MKITVSAYGVTEDGQRVERYVLENSRGIRISVITFGAIITHLTVPDRTGAPVDIVLGYDSLADYERDDCYFGACIGRVANRLKDARFSLHGKEYRLEANDGLNHLHGVFCKRVWRAQVYGNELCLRYHSPDGEDGFPGAVDVAVTYSLDENGVLGMKYDAIADADTLLNLTNHTYFNLSGHDSGKVDDQLLQIAADEYLETADDCCPTGITESVEGTPMDFRTLRRIGQGFPIHFEQMELVGGYDHNYCLRPDAAPAALAYSPATGIALSLVTTQPGMQLYSGNFISGALPGKGGVRYGQRHGFCLETQHYPCAPSYPAFPPILLRRGERYQQSTFLQFQTLNEMK